MQQQTPVADGNLWEDWRTEIVWSSHMTGYNVNKLNVSADAPRKDQPDHSTIYAIG